MRSPSPPALLPVALAAGAALWALASDARAQQAAEPAEPAVQSTATVRPTTSTEPEQQIQTDAIFPTAARGRAPWQLLGLYELHFNLVSDEYAASDWLSYYQLRGDRNLTEHDQVSLRMDLEQRYIADSGEAGLWFGDMRFYYSRMFKLPVDTFELPAKASLYLTAPTSRASRRRGYITQPTASLTLAPSWGPLSLVAIGSFRYSFAWYAESWSGTPNTQLTAGATVQVYYSIFDWLAPSVAWVSSWSLPYETREGEGQPIREEYYFEAAINVSVPMPESAPKVDVSLAYAQGANTLEDGVYRLYFTKRDQSEIYLGVNLTY